MRRYLVDASVLIALASCGRLDILRACTGVAFAPQAVLAEVRPNRTGAARVAAAISDGWLRELPGQVAIARGLGAGESALLGLAGEGDILVLDDRTARIHARAKGLAVTGLIGLLVTSAKAARISTGEAKAALDALERSDFRITAELIRSAKKELP